MKTFFDRLLRCIARIIAYPILLPLAIYLTIQELREDELTFARWHG